MDWFLYDSGLRHERIKLLETKRGLCDTFSPVSMKQKNVGPNVFKIKIKYYQQFYEILQKLY